MGSLFKTTTPQNVDFMYKLPENLMFKVADQASKDITENQSVIYSLYDKIKLAALNPDKEEAKKIVNGYETQINDLTAQLQENPLAFRRKGGEIMGLSRTIQKDFTTGKAAAIAGNYSLDAEWVKEQQGLIKSGRIKDAENVSKMRNWQLQKYADTGGVAKTYDPNTGNYGQFQTEEMVAYVDLVKKFDEYAKPIVAQITATSSAGPDKDGNYLVEYDGKRERLSKDEIKNVVLQKFQSDDEVQNYLKQRSKIGAISGWYNQDEKGNPTTMRTDAESSLVKIMSATAETYDKNNVLSSHSSIKNDSLKTGTTPFNITPGSQQGSSLAGGINQTNGLPVTDQALQVKAQIDANITKTLDQAKVTVENLIGNKYSKISRNDSLAVIVGLPTAIEQIRNGFPNQLKGLLKRAGISQTDADVVLNQVVNSIISKQQIDAQINSTKSLVKDESIKAGKVIDDDAITKKANELLGSTPNDVKSNLRETNGENYKVNMKEVSKAISQEALPDYVGIMKTDSTGVVTKSFIPLAQAETLVQEADREQNPSNYVKNQTTGIGEQMDRSIRGLLKDRAVTKVLQTVNFGTDKLVEPYRLSIGSTSIFLPASVYTSKKLDEGIAKDRDEINIHNAYDRAKELSVINERIATRLDVPFKHEPIPILSTSGIYVIPSGSGNPDIMINFPGGIIVDGVKQTQVIGKMGTKMMELIKLKESQTK